MQEPYLPHVCQMERVRGNDFVILIADFHHKFLSHLFHTHLKLNAIHTVPKSIDGGVSCISTCQWLLRLAYTQLLLYSAIVSI